MKIGVHGKEFKKEAIPFITEIFEYLFKRDQEVYISSKFESLLKHQAFKKFSWSTYEPGADLKEFDFFISVGGDGTLLESVTHIGGAEVPILGINTGRLGFLATINKADIQNSLDKVIAGAYTIDKRAVLKFNADKEVFGNLNFALNDFTVVKKDTSSMITIHTYIDGEFLNSYWSDGIIVATPTGSTGYSLSCGGPLISPSSGNFVITPISPHNLTVRPIIVSDASEISFRVEGRSRKFLVSLDSRISTVDHTFTLKIKKGDFKVNLIQLHGQHYFKTLRQKLNWGLDIRN
ncbi:NAD kinase [Chryseosolibacter indicus]|uniref:NAD kinase n=1 Tax=Chryseosolibacter indicus TaxID=2782351 RepID=A0ABS5W159_9BACT|nr:NAD kinase [Chryseosolibacter indicus]MBT1706006.1 NAD kinase [Chryseosolibacter indicus]